MANLTVQQLTTITNKDYKWSSWWGQASIVRVDTEEAIIAVSDRRIYFLENLPYATSELFIDRDEAMIAATAIFNSHF
jgi:hypothetical protein